MVPIPRRLPSLLRQGRTPVTGRFGSVVEHGEFRHLLSLKG